MDMITYARLKKFATGGGTNPVQSDWNQNDKSALDFIKNKPFYGSDEIKWVELVINPSLNAPTVGYCYNITPGASLALDKEYKVIVDGKEYICSSRQETSSDGYSGIAIGAENSGGLFFEPPVLKDTSIPFHIVNTLGDVLYAAFPDNQAPTNLQIYIKQVDMKLLDRKFINYIPGERVSDKEVVYNGIKTTCGNGAEVFNDLKSNMAIGDYSHAEGSGTVSSGECSHAEGNDTIAEGTYAHAEGYATTASNSYGHAEGESTIASGFGSHAEGQFSEAKGDYSHATGSGTVAATRYSVAQGLYNIADAEDGKAVYYPVTPGKISTENLDKNTIVYRFINHPELDLFTGEFYGEIESISIAELQEDDCFVFNQNSTKPYYVVAFISENPDDNTQMTLNHYQMLSYPVYKLGKYAHTVGNGGSIHSRSNAHTLDWEGNAWYQGDVYVGSTSGTNKDEGSKKLATEDYVNSSISTAKNELLNGAGDAYDTLKELGELIDENQDAIEALETIAASKADWEQNDENAIDYIKNKPFGDTGKFEETELFNQNVAFRAAGANGEILVAQVMSGCPIIASGITYKIIIGTYEYIGQSDSGELGNESLLFGPPIQEGEPFYCLSTSGVGIFSLDSSFFTETNLNIAIYQMKPIINSLPRKFIEEYSAGYKADIQDYEYDGQIYNSNFGAEIFNDTSNKAIGEYSHAEGNQTITIGAGAHAEGGFTEAIGSRAHAEGSSTKAIGNYSHAEGMMTKALGADSHAEGMGTEATYNSCHAEGWYTIANTPFLHVQGAFNIPEENPLLFNYGYYVEQTVTYEEDKEVYIYDSRPSLDRTTGIFTAGNSHKKSVKELKADDYFSMSDYSNSVIENYECLYVEEVVASDPDTNATTYSFVIRQLTASPRNTQPGKYLHIVGNGDTVNRSNAHTLEADGTAWYAGDVYVGSTSGVNRDEGSKKLLTADDLVQPNWEQNDEASLDFIKNKPFYDTGEYDFIPVFEDGVFGRLSSYAYFGDDLMVDFILGAFYKVVFNGVDYICEAKKEGQFVYLGNPVGYLETFADIYMTDLSTLDWGTGEPFCIFNGTMIVKDGSSVPKLSIYKRKPIINMLDRKYIDYIPGENTSLKKITLEDDTEYICGDGSEIFNDYINNKAIGEYSHAGGFNTIASGSYSYTEAFETVAEGAYAHAEGCRTKAIGLGSHAEGDGAEAKGQYSHAEGQSTVALGHRAHVEGMNTLAIGAASHVQGKYNLIDDSAPRYSKGTVAYFDWPEYDGEKIVYLLNQDPEFNNQTGKFTITNEVTEIAYKNLQKDNIFLFTRPENNIISNYYRIEDLVSSRENGNVTLYKYKYYKCDSYEEIGGNNARLAHIVGNGTSEENRSNAHTLDWEGNAWYAGSVECTSLILKSSTEGSNKRFRVTIDDNGELHTEEIVE